jgi:hypothetical protein
MAEKTNKKTGTEFESKVKQWFEVHRKLSFDKKKIEIGDPPGKKHEFDLVNETEKIAIECKCYTWKAKGSNPSAKISTLNEAVFFLSFLRDYKRIIVINKAFTPEKKETLAEYYFRTYCCLLGKTIIAEFDPQTDTMRFFSRF